MTKYKASSDIELSDPPIKATKGSIVSFREVTLEVQGAVNSGLLIPMGVTPSKRVESKERVEPLAKEPHDIKYLVSAVTTITKQLQELTDKVDALSKRKK